MAIIPREEKKTRSSLVFWIILFFIIGILGNLLIFFWPASVPEERKEELLVRDDRRLNGLHFNLGVLQSKNFLELKSYGEDPHKGLSEGGRDNPFNQF